MTFIFATSGNSRGLIFKNLAKTEHELKVKNDFGMPAAEEIFEQVTEKKPPTSILKFPYFPIEQRDMLHLNYFLNRSILLHINDIVIPPPKFFVKRIFRPIIRSTIIGMCEACPHFF